MSATQDKSQKATFVYNNLYQLYRKGKNAASQAETPTAPAVESPELAKPLAVSSRVIKTADRHEVKITEATPAPAPQVEEFRPAQLIGKRVARPASLPPVSSRAAAVESLRDNLRQLNDLHSRLRFMLQELEELTKE